MKKVYIAHPLRGENREKNVAEVTKICKKITELFPDVLPISQIHSFSLLDDCGKEGEEKAMELCIEMLKNCDEVWFFGNWAKSEGCSAEYDAACARNYIKRFVYSFQDCERILASAEFPLDKGPRVELARWLLEEVYEPPIKPCPFCGSEVVLNSEYGFIACGNDDCLMTCSINWGNRAIDRVKTRAEAIAAWNRRA